MSILGEWAHPWRALLAAWYAVGWQLGNADGFDAGYRSGLAASNDAWREASGQRVFTTSEWVDKSSAAERKAKRQAILTQGHEAGLHVGRVPVNDCPVCLKAQPIPAPAGGAVIREWHAHPIDVGADRSGMWSRYEAGPKHPGPESTCLLHPMQKVDDAESQLHHKGNYGVSGASEPAVPADAPEGAHTHVPREGGKCVRCGARGVSYAGVPWYTR